MPTSPSSPEIAARTGDEHLVLRADGISAGYGQVTVVNEVSISVHDGAIVSIIGPNGSGKSTLMKTLAGEVRPKQGTIMLGASDVTGLRQDRLAHLGVAYVRQEREVFPWLTVQENLQAGGFLLRKREVDTAMSRVFDRFPILKQRRKTMAGSLSGGERKMLALGRVLMVSPRLVLLDEPSAGLSPLASAELLEEHVPRLVAEGTSVLLVEQRALQALRYSNYAYMLAGGRVVTSGSGHDLLSSDNLVATLLGQRARPSTNV